VTVDILFLPFFVGAILRIVWLVTAGLWLAFRPPVSQALAGQQGSLG